MVNKDFELCLLHIPIKYYFILTDKIDKLLIINKSLKESILFS